MKPIVSSTIKLMLIFSFSLILLTSHKGNALILAHQDNILSSNNKMVYAVNVFLCLVALPICLANDDEISSNTNHVSKSSLLAKGYPEEKIERIQKAQDEFTQSLSDMNKTIGFELNETLESLEKGMKEIDPNVSEEYIKFVADQAGLSI